jgi:hypothetical protein
MFVAMPTAMPADPLTSRFGNGAAGPWLPRSSRRSWDEVDGLLVEIRHHLVAERLEPRFGVSHRRRRVAVDRSEVALAVHQRVAHVEVLRQRTSVS